MEITNLTKKRIVEYINKGKRVDGRSTLEYRPIAIEVNAVKKAEGSAIATVGKTTVIAGVKLDIVEPYPNEEDEGTLIVTVELLPLASEKFRPGPPSIGAIELARIVDRGIRESGFINFKKLCIKKGEKVWAVLLDIYILNDDGNLIDSAALASVAALKTALLPSVKNDKVDYGNLTAKHLPLTDAMPLTLTFYKIGQSIILDPTTEEEEAIDARISIAISRPGNKEAVINALQKGGSTALTEEEICAIVDMAIKEREKLYNLFEQKLAQKEKQE